MKKPLCLASLSLAAFLAACATASPQDAKLSSDVEASLNSHPALQADLLRVQVADHVAYLNGVADTWLEYHEAEQVALAVPGVTRVVNKITIKGGRE